jgi:hypothetical protein
VEPLSPFRISPHRMSEDLLTPAETVGYDGRIGGDRVAARFDFDNHTLRGIVLVRKLRVRVKSSLWWWRSVGAAEVSPSVDSSGIQQV